MTTEQLPPAFPHPDTVAFAEALAGMLGNRFSEFAELARVTNVRGVASDRVRFVTVYVRDDRPVELAPASIDRARVTILPVTAAIHLGDSQQVTADGIDGVTLAVGVGVSIDTRGRVWAIADSAAPVEVGVLIEQWDAQ